LGPVTFEIRPKSKIDGGGPPHNRPSFPDLDGQNFDLSNLWYFKSLKVDFLDLGFLERLKSLYKCLKNGKRSSKSCITKNKRSN